MKGSSRRVDARTSRASPAAQTSSHREDDDRRDVERILDQAVATRWAKPHDDVVGKQDGVEPAPELDRQVERRQCALADDDRVDELDRDVLRVGRVGAAPERQQPAALAGTGPTSPGRRPRAGRLRARRTPRTAGCGLPARPRSAPSGCRLWSSRSARPAIIALCA